MPVRERWGTSNGQVLVLASTGGADPLRAVLEALPSGTVTIIYRTAAPAEVGLRDELHALAAAYGTRAYYLPASGPTDPGPLAAPQLRARIPVLRRHDVHVCGPPAPAAAAARALRAAGIPSHRISRVLP
jgi:NAD(P)H-flavin reductase